MGHENHRGAIAPPTGLQDLDEDPLELLVDPGELCVVPDLVVGQRETLAPARGWHRVEDPFAIAARRHELAFGVRLYVPLELLGALRLPQALEVVHVHVGEPVLVRGELPRPLQETLADSLPAAHGLAQVLPSRGHEVAETDPETGQVTDVGMIGESRRGPAVGHELERKSRQES